MSKRKAKGDFAVHFREASDPATPTERLDALAYRYQYDRGMRRALAGNPNISETLMVNFLAEFPDVAIENPALPFFMMRDPRLIDKLSSNTLQTLLRRENIPSVFVAAALRSPNQTMRAEAKSHVATAGEVTDMERELVSFLYAEQKQDMHIFVEAYLDLPDFLPDWFVTMVREANEGRWNGYERQIVLLHDDERTLFISLTVNGPRGMTTLPPDVQLTPEEEELASQHTVFVNTEEMLAQSPSTPPETLANLASSVVLPVRRFVAVHPSTPVEALQRLASDQDLGVIKHLMSNPNLTPEICAQLAAHPDPFVQAGIAPHPHLPPDVVLRLAQSSNKNVALAALENPFAPTTAIDMWMNRLDKDVALTIARGPHLTLAIARTLLGLNQPLQVQKAIAANPATPPGYLGHLMKRSGTVFKEGIAQNPSAPASFLIELAAHKSAKVRELVAEHPSLPLAAQGRLLADMTPVIQQKLIANPATQPAILISLAQTIDDVGTLRQISEHPRMNRETRRSIYGAYLHRQLLNQANSYIFKQYIELTLMSGIPVEPPSTYRSMDNDWRIRLLTLYATRTDVRTMQELTHDGNRFVRAAARLALAKRQPTQKEST